ncbi:MAG: hypothetical protein CMD08_02075 [Flavobacteriales bacterium]|nr:hypothetical protein [Flavobacteriales bacterium]
MDKYFAYKGKKKLTEAKKSQTDNEKFHLGSVDIAIKRCNRIWGEGNFKLYRFQDFNNNDTYEMIL